MMASLVFFHLILSQENYIHSPVARICANGEALPNLSARKQTSSCCVETILIPCWRGVKSRHGKQSGEDSGSDNEVERQAYDPSSTVWRVTKSKDPVLMRVCGRVEGSESKM